MKILLTGSQGQVGWELKRALAPLGEIVALNRQQFDMSQPKTLREIILDIKPNWIVNAAAYTDVDKAELEHDLVYRINSESPRKLAEICAELNAILIHYSTDYVFDGTNHVPFKEEDPTRPLNVYGASKALGEIEIQKTCSKHLIFRTSSVYGQRGKNFFLTIQKLMRERRELRIVNDQIISPTWSRHIAEATSLIMMQVIFSLQNNKNFSYWGTYHLTNSGETSWFGFAETILKTMMLDNKPILTAIPSTEYPLPALRPLNSRLSNLKLKKNLGISLPSWQIALEQAIEKY